MRQPDSRQPIDVSQGEHNRTSQAVVQLVGGCCTCHEIGPDLIQDHLHIFICELQALTNICCWCCARSHPACYDDDIIVSVYHVRQREQEGSSVGRSACLRRAIVQTFVLAVECFASKSHVLGLPKCLLKVL